MTVEAIPRGNGGTVSKAKGVCDDCGREEVVTADYERVGTDWKVNAAQVVTKLTQGRGWSHVKHKLRCPTCEGKRKVVKLKKPEPSPSEQPPREPTRAQRREIMTELGEVYDTEAGRYRGDATDEQVAVLLDVMPGWVTAIRQEFFGDGGDNEAMGASAEEIEAEIAKLQDALRDCEQAAADARVAIRRAQDLQKQIEAIRKAVGPRVLKAVGA